MVTRARKSSEASESKKQEAEGRLVFVSERIVFCIRSGTVRLREQGFVQNQVLVYAVRDRLALGACSLFGTNFCWFGSGSRFFFVWSEILLCMRSPLGSEGDIFIVFAV